MFEEFDLQALRRVPQFAHYFRYPLRHQDFHEVREQGRLLGRMAAKPLYGRLTVAGKVDRSAGFNGQVAVIFIPARADAARRRVIDYEDAAPVTKMPRRRVTKASGRRNWGPYMRRLKPLCEITARQSSTGRQSPLSEGQTNIWTVGHSTLTIGDFLEMLSSNGIRALADVRRFPASRRHPQFNQDELRESLAAAGIEYLHLPELGGRRQARPDSRNTVWRNPSFRGYADYMETDAFRAGVERLLQFARDKRTAVMCAEAVWWRCHRALIADYLKASGVNVIHINSAARNTVHPYTSAARISNGQLSYAAASRLAR